VGLKSRQCDKSSRQKPELLHKGQGLKNYQLNNQFAEESGHGTNNGKTTRHLVFTEFIEGTVFARACEKTD